MTPTVWSSNWRESILRHFPVGSAPDLPVTVVSDPRGLLADAIIHEALKDRGFTTWAYDDPLGFRIRYEHEIRAVCDIGGTPPSLVIACRREGTAYLPFDMLSRARAYLREFRFNVSDLFLGLAPASLEDLEPVWFDALYEAMAHDPAGEPRGLVTSREFLLRELFGVEVQKFDRKAEFLSALCRLHIHRRELPGSLASYVVDRIEEMQPSVRWPLAGMVRDRTAFFEFLQEQWPDFVERLAIGEGRESVARYGASPDLIPFDDPVLRTWMGALFLEGALEPVALDGTPELWPDEYRWGIVEQSKPDEGVRALALATELSSTIPSAEATYEEWLAFAPRWATFSALTLRSEKASGDVMDMLGTLWERVDQAFRGWMLRDYGALELVPKPIMLHRVLGLLRARWASGSKIALLVMDGMAWNQWATLRDGLVLPEGTYIDEQSVFAWVPTITPVSRQALFAGMPPREFANSIKTTQKDREHWSRFWIEHGLDSTSAQFVPPRHSEAPEAALGRLREAAEHPLCRVLAMTVSTIDEMSHGAVGGTPALLTLVDHWSRTGWLADGLRLLLKQDFEIWITADHGNIECVGMGRPNEGALSEGRGARARMFSDESVRRSILEQYSSSLAWKGAGLPAEYLPLISTGQSAFDTKGQTIISHGGISLEEVIVPLVRIHA